MSGSNKDADALAFAQDAWGRAARATDPAHARRWLERAHRIVPNDDMVALRLAAVCLALQDAEAAAALFRTVTQRLDMAEAWLGLAASALRLADLPCAVSALRRVLSSHAVPQQYHPLATAIAAAAGLPGWCAVDGAGLLHADAPSALSLDGQAIPARWQGAACRVPASGLLTVQRQGLHLLGSPVDLGRVHRVEGFAEAVARGVRGWAWRPGNPARPPTLTLRWPDGAERRITPRRIAQDAGHPAARLRGFHLRDLAPGPVVLAGDDGRTLLGSPVDPGLAARLQPVPVGTVGPPKTRVPRRPAVDVVVPVHGGGDVTRACLQSVLRTLPPGSRLHIVDDAGPDPALARDLAALVQPGRVLLHRLPRSLGFPGAANAGLRAATGRDVVLLNSDTLVPPGWLEALADAAHSAPDIASACPMSNDATILSYPDPGGGNPMTDPAPLSALLRRANGTETIDIPVGVGFCLYLRADCIAQTGLLREDVFAQGYGEENDWCLRARHAGWRHVAVTGCFVAHLGAGSFGPARRHLLARNSAILEQLHPGYFALVQAWIAADPLGPARRRADLLRFRAGRLPSSVVLVTHDHGGGVERVVQHRAAALRAEGVRPVILRPDGQGVIAGDGGTPNLRFGLPGEWPALLRLLRAERVVAVELHHMLGHDPALAGLAARLDVPHDVVIHDYASLCVQLSLVRGGSYCGEPPVAACEACVAAHGQRLEQAVTPGTLLHRSAALFAAARQVSAPSQDAATRLRRHFPAVRVRVTPWEDDAAIVPPPALRRPVRRVCVPGAIGVEKGFGVLLACVRDAARRGLGLEYVVVGHTDDDLALLEAGPVFITGRYTEAEAVTLLRSQDADVAFIPSVWPETWCFALSLAWRAGLPALVFDIGAPAERVRRTGWGHVLPLGLGASALNDWLLQPGPPAAISGARHTPSPLTINPAI